MDFDGFDDGWVERWRLGIGKKADESEAEWRLRWRQEDEVNRNCWGRWSWNQATLCYLENQVWVPKVRWSANYPAGCSGYTRGPKHLQSAHSHIDEKTAALSSLAQYQLLVFKIMSF